MCLRSLGIDDDDSGVGRRRRARGLSDLRGIGDNDGGSRVSAMGLRDLRRRWRRRQRMISTKNSTTTAEALAEDIRRVKGIRHDDGGGSGLTTGPMDWQRPRSVDFPCYRVTNSNTVSYLSCCCLVLIFFSSDSFPPVYYKKDYQYCNHVENIFVSSVH